MYCLLTTTAKAAPTRAATSGIKNTAANDRGRASRGIPRAGDPAWLRLDSVHSWPERSPSPCKRVVLARPPPLRSEEHTSELQSRSDLVCRLLLEKKKHITTLANKALNRITKALD